MAAHPSRTGRPGPPPALALAMALAMAMALAAGCARTRPAPGPPLPDLSRIAVLPVDRASVRPGQEKATCALSDTTFAASEVNPEQAEAVTRVLFELVEGDPRFRPVPEGRCLGLLGALLAADVKATQLRLIRAFGRELGADAVLYVKLFRFSEREGTAYGVRRPASVAFNLHLIRVADGAVLWRAAFDETQKPVSENLLALDTYRRRAVRWLTAAELARMGLEAALADLRRRLP
ncbi:hypothetical protein G3N55_02675 [Dissulfurirhabdus thermomarina]|uniref:Penicillin-binding protein activator LpoB n=1 Tax=Dissulfurirhabdus thermomarina TaxID=1765737 RepID=A0A6N9TQN8_DISTH|nr:hypothetical protein [Dissulfurirhabdus thermomarina]NDY41757.1 hypothetical protein [Dissulfurirhabdus thermomarina]NMX24032.1 hypothetical protein [Dissulfurirhabdus thermomarina]